MLIFLGDVAVVVLAEIGDKMQLLAMAFATRFPAGPVLWGVFIATLLNHGLAVALGNYLGTSLNVKLVQMAAAGSFIIFGLWTIRGDTISDEHKKRQAGALSSPLPSPSFLRNWETKLSWPLLRWLPDTVLLCSH